MPVTLTNSLAPLITAAPTANPAATTAANPGGLASLTGAASTPSSTTAAGVKGTQSASGNGTTHASSANAVDKAHVQWVVGGVVLVAALMG
jgi:hypothetical protein